MAIQQIYSADDPLGTTPPSLLFELLASNGDLETAQRPKYLSPTSMTVSPDEKFIYIAEQTAKQIDVFSVVSNSVIKSFLMPNEPTGIAVDSSGLRLYVTCASERWPNGIVCVVNAASGIIENRISVGHMARSPVLSPDEKNLYVCNWLEGTISFIDLSAAKETRVPAIREPYSMAISKNGNSLIVANLIPDGVATDTTMTSKICFISTSTGKIEKSIKLYKGSHSTMSVRLTPDGKYALIPHLIANFTQIGGKITEGWVHSNNMSIIDVENQVLLNDVEIDGIGQGYANPWDIACTDDGKWICIAHAGYDVVNIIDMPALFKKLVGKGDASRDYSFMTGLKKEVRMGIRSPRSIVTIGSKAYVTGFFSHSLEVVDLSAASPTPTTYALAPEKPLTVERKGESFFCNAKLCQEQWQTCQSCHPFTRPDGLNWILSDAINASAKNAKSMLLSWQTPPTNWTLGKRINTFESIRAGISIELMTDPSEEMGLSLDTFFMRLKPVPSPKLVKGKLSESAQRGKIIYNDKQKGNCAVCHPAPLFTHLKSTYAGVLDDLDNSAFDTPSLIEAWRTGPYDHLGSHDKIEDDLKIPGHANDVDLNKLSDSEFKDLIEYVLSL